MIDTTVPWRFKPSLRAALERGLLALAGVYVFFIPFIIGSFFGESGPIMAGGFATVNILASIVLPILFSFAPAIQVLFTTYTIDEDGLREEVSILSKTQRRVTWEKVTALRHRRTLIDRILGIQRLDVIAYGERGATIHLIGLRDQAGSIRDHVAMQMRRNVDLGRLLSND